MVWEKKSQFLHFLAQWQNLAGGSTIASRDGFRRCQRCTWEYCVALRTDGGHRAGHLERHPKLSKVVGTLGHSDWSSFPKRPFGSFSKWAVKKTGWSSTGDHCSEPSGTMGCSRGHLFVSQVYLHSWKQNKSKAARLHDEACYLDGFKHVFYFLLKILGRWSKLTIFFCFFSGGSTCPGIDVIAPCCQRRSRGKIHWS